MQTAAHLEELDDHVHRGSLRRVGPRHRVASRSLAVEVAAIASLLGLAVVFVAPALSHGSALGPYDLLSQFGLTSQLHVNVHNFVDSDEIQEFIPWEALAWSQVHAGHFPLWNPDSVLGLPLAFNLQSAPFSPSVLIGYLFPLALSHSATLTARLAIAGVGAYAAARAMRLEVLPSLVSATIYELCGGFTIWLGAYEADCMAFAGWVLAGSMLVLRGKRRLWSIGVLAVSLWCSLLAGEPQIVVVLVCSVVIFAAVVALRWWFATARRRALIALGDHVLALLLAGALSAPLYLPGIQLGLDSARAAGPTISGLPVYDLTHFVFAAYNGTPTSLGSIIGPDNLYVSMVYVGTIGAVLAVTALSMLRRRGDVLALLLVTVVLLLLLFCSPLLSLLAHVPIIGVTRILLATTMLDLCLALLAGIGAHALIAHRGERSVERLFAVCTLGMAVVLGLLWLRTALNASHLPDAQLALRRASFLWPTVGLVALLCMLVVRTNSLRRSRRTHAGSAAVPDVHRGFRHGRVEVVFLLVVEAGLLCNAGSGILSSSSSFLPASSGTAGLQRIVGKRLVGFGSCGENSFPFTGLLPNVNLAYGVDELAVYDPILPKSYYASWGKAAKTTTAVLEPPGVFCPAITTLTEARLYGVSYLLEPAGMSAPAGTRLVAKLEGEGLYAVPGSGRATLQPLDGGKVVVAPSAQPTPASWRVEVRAQTPSRLVLRISAVPGWHASIDGKPLAMTPYDGSMLQATVPAGTHIVTLSYRPLAFVIGCYLAVGAILGFLVCVGVATRRGRRARRERSRTLQLHPAVAALRALPTPG